MRLRSANAVAASMPTDGPQDDDVLVEVALEVMSSRSMVARTVSSGAEGLPEALGQGAGPARR